VDHRGGVSSLTIGLTSSTTMTIGTPARPISGLPTNAGVRTTCRTSPQRAAGPAARTPREFDCVGNPRAAEGYTGTTTPTASTHGRARPTPTYGIKAPPPPPGEILDGGYFATEVIRRWATSLEPVRPLRLVPHTRAIRGPANLRRGRGRGPKIGAVGRQG